MVLDGGPADVYVPQLLARAEVPYVRARPEVDHTERYALLAEVADAPDWASAEALADRPETTATPAGGATFATVPEALRTRASYDRWGDGLKRWLQAERPLVLLQPPRRS